jgi:hypothetical protein
LAADSTGPAVLWDCRAGRKLSLYPFGEGGSLGATLALTPDGRIAAFGGSTARLVDVGTGKPLARLPDGRFPAFSPDGKALATAHRDERRWALSTWDTAKGKLLRRFPWPRKPDDFQRPAALVYTPDGRSVVTGWLDGTVRLWEAATGGQQVAYLTHPRQVTAVAVSADGRYLASAGEDRFVRVRALVSGWSVARLGGHRGRITALAFTPDGRQLWSASEDGTVLVWRGPDREARDPPAKLSDAELEALWRALAGRDAAAAYDASRRLLASPGAAVAYLRGRLRPVPPLEPGRAERLVADLHDRRLATRRRAERDLEKLGRLAELALRQVLADPRNEEARRRAAALLARVAPDEMSAGELPQWRALEVAEYADTPEARRFLEELARGAPGALLTRWASAALKRLKRHPPSTRQPRTR